MMVKVLVLEPDPKIQSLLKINLERRHFRVVQTRDYRQCLVYLSMYVPDLIILDPAADTRREFLSNLTVHYTSIPLIFTTKLPAEMLPAQDITLNLIGTLFKPFDPTHLLKLCSFAAHL